MADGGRRRAPYKGDTLPSYQEQYEALEGWIKTVTPEGASVCDVGGGGHFITFPQRLRPWATRMVGVDPDPGVLERPWYDEAHQALAEDWAPVATERFDVVTAVYVLEHVEAPADFLGAVHRLLVPGGSLFAVTPNLWHYFGLISAAAARLGLEERLLRWLRGGELVEQYHFPVRYRLNSLPTIARQAAAAGFTAVEFRCIEDPNMVVDYLPPRLQAAGRRYSAAVNRWGRPELFGTILVRLRA